MAGREPWFVSERAEALAIVHLTRRKDLEIVPVPQQRRSTGYDLLVYLLDGGRPIGQSVFAVKVKGVQSRDTKLVAAELVRAAFSSARDNVRIESLPVCLFLFQIDSEQSYYSWLYEPIISPDGKAELQPNHALLSDQNGHALRQPLTAGISALDDKAIGEIIDRVSEWYRVKESKFAGVR